MTSFETPAPPTEKFKIIELQRDKNEAINLLQTAQQNGIFVIENKQTSEIITFNPEITIEDIDNQIKINYGDSSKREIDKLRKIDRLKAGFEKSNTPSNQELKEPKTIILPDTARIEHSINSNNEILTIKNSEGKLLLIISFRKNPH
jgi:hypothetical protein